MIYDDYMDFLRVIRDILCIHLKHCLLLALILSMINLSALPALNAYICRPPCMGKGLYAFISVAVFLALSFFSAGILSEYVSEDD